MSTQDKALEFRALEVDAHLAEGGKDALLTVVVSPERAISISLSRSALERLQARIFEKLST